MADPLPLPQLCNPTRGRSPVGLHSSSIGSPSTAPHLVSMGFARGDVERALRATYGDENAAADRLLES